VTQAHGALHREEQPLWLPLAVSFVGHVGVIVVSLAVSAVVGTCRQPEPIIQDALEVSVVSLPKSKTNVPDKATRAAVQQGTDAPQPAPKPPPVESDLVIQQPKPVPKPGPTDADRRKREEEMRKLERERLMEDLMAADGAVDRDATDPNSQHDVAINVNGKGASKADPEYIAWVAKVQRLMMSNFHPLSAIVAKNPGLKTRVLLEVDPTSGRILERTVQTSSGIPAFDAAATRAVDDVGTIPLPPEAWLPLLASGLAIDFTPP
jgi:outer membrane biosynthesis protein TonB